MIGRMISDTGTSIQMMIMPLYIIDAGGNATTIGLFSFASLVPALFVYPFAGVLGDRLNRKAIMVITDLASACVILLLAFISYFDRMSLTLLLVGQIIISLLNGLFDPATRGMMPQLVAQEELNVANSKMASLRGLSVLLGPVIGSLMYSEFGITILFFINGFSFLLSGISEMLIRYKHVKSKSVEGISEIVSDLSRGIRFILSNKTIRMACYFLIVIYFLVQPIFAVALPLFFKTRLEYSNAQYGYLQSISILGMILGSTFVGWIFGKESGIVKPLKVGCSLLIVSMLMFSLLMFPYTLSVLGNDTILYFLLLAVVFCLFSAANMFINVPIQSFIQRETPMEYMSRVFSIIGMITRGGMPLGALVYGILLSRVDTHWPVFVSTLLMTLISITFIKSFIKAHEL
ncbi:MFS transporter [Clostridium tunisiense]|uniref:MFS transporter n=1 Tax=Clostridium tunisiense TaxID=219748 RepID=UPI001FA78BCC|nr:MFS transporter [Clostridium tunisiense]